MMITSQFVQSGLFCWGQNYCCTDGNFMEEHLLLMVTIRRWQREMFFFWFFDGVFLPIMWNFPRQTGRFLTTHFLCFGTVVVHHWNEECCRFYCCSTQTGSVGNVSLIREKQLYRVETNWTGLRGGEKCLETFFTFKEYFGSIHILNKVLLNVQNFVARHKIICIQIHFFNSLQGKKCKKIHSSLDVPQCSVLWCHTINVVSTASSRMSPNEKANQIWNPSPICPRFHLYCTQTGQPHRRLRREWRRIHLLDAIKLQYICVCAIVSLTLCVRHL